MIFKKNKKQTKILNGIQIPFKIGDSILINKDPENEVVVDYVNIFKKGTIVGWSYHYDKNKVDYGEFCLEELEDYLVIEKSNKSKREDE